MASAGRRDTRAEGVGGAFDLAADGQATAGLSLDGPAAGSRRTWELYIERADSGMIPRSLMLGTTERAAGPKPPSGLPKLFPIDHHSKPPRLGSLDALTWGCAATSPLQDAILVWLQWGRGECVVRAAVLHRARTWPMAPGRLALIVDTALTHAPALTYNQRPPAWLNYQTEFVNRVNEVLSWINKELAAAHAAISLTRNRKNRPKWYNGIREIEKPARFSDSLLRRAAA